MNTNAFRTSTLLAALFVGAALLPSSLAAQRSSSADSSYTMAPGPAGMETAVPTSAVGPRIAPAGITRPIPADLPAADQERNVGMGSNMALMGVGAAAIVVGLIVGGDGGNIIAVTGGVIGLVGLYRYLR